MLHHESIEFCTNICPSGKLGFVSTGRFGVELDSLIDVVTFLVGIGIFGVMAGLDSTISLVIIMAFVISGIMRLSRFSVTGTIEGHYIGLPVGYNVSIPVIYFVLLFFNLSITAHIIISLLWILILTPTSCSWNYCHTFF